MTQFNLSSRVLLVLASLAATIAEANAVIVYDNLSQVTVGGFTVDPVTQQAQRIAPLSQSFTLTSITLIMRGDSSGARLSLFSGDETVPITEVGVLNSPESITSEYSENTFLTPGINMTAGVNYWVVLGATSGNFLWGYTESPAGQGEGFAVEWASNSDASWQAFSGSPYQMAVSATAVPEPATLAMQGSLALAGFALVRGVRNHRRRNSASR